MIERYLERLFTWESLENTERGVEFELKNRLVETEFTSLTTVRIDGEEVPLEDVRLELGDGTVVAPEEVTEQDPLVFDLADTMQVISEIDRLTLGEHEVSMGFEVENYGRVSFTTDDEVTEDDLVDADVSGMDADEVVSLVESIREPVALRRMLDEERTNEKRDRVVEALEERLGEVRHIEERRELVEEGTRIDERIEERLENAFEGRRRLIVYGALRRTDGGDVEDVARETGMGEETVESLLQDMEMNGTAEYDYGTGKYEAASPSEIAVERASGFVDAVKDAVDGLR